MKRRVLLTALTIALTFSGMMANNHMSDSNKKYASNDNKFAFSLQLPYNFNKLGVGIRFAYNFTDILRFSLDGDYFFYTSPSRTFNTITHDGVKGSMGWGRMIDVNPNLNFVFGEKDFHFYLITGIYFSFGYRQITNGIADWVDGGVNTVVINGSTYYYKDKLVPSIGLGFNGGCGIEYQITDEFRMFFEQQLSLGWMTSWMAKLGASFCF